MECYICFQDMSSRGRITLCGQESHAVCVACHSKKEISKITECPMCRYINRDYIQRYIISREIQSYIFTASNRGFYLNQITMEAGSNFKMIISTEIKIIKHGNLKQLSKDQIERDIKQELFQSIVLEYQRFTENPVATFITITLGRYCYQFHSHTQKIMLEICSCRNKERIEIFTNNELTNGVY